MDKARFDKGLEVRTAVLGKDYVEASMKNADDFNRPFQELVTEYCWGAAWGSDGLSRKTRSMLNIAMISILNRPHELKLHVKGALKNGVTKDEIREVMIQVAIYAGVPCGVDAFRRRPEPHWARGGGSCELRRARRSVSCPPVSISGPSRISAIPEARSNAPPNC